VADKKEWDRIDGEPQLWHSRFEKFYLVLGTERSLMAAYKVWRIQKDTIGHNGNGNGEKKINGIPNRWWHTSKTWRWQDRAEAWDTEQREQRLKEEEELRLQMRKTRRALLSGFIGKFAPLLQEFNLRDAPSLSEMTKGLETLLKQMREEYDDLPTLRIGGEEPGKPIRIEIVDAVVGKEMFEKEDEG